MAYELANDFRIHLLIKKRISAPICSEKISAAAWHCKCPDLGAKNHPIFGLFGSKKLQLQRESATSRSGITWRSPLFWSGLFLSKNVCERTVRTFIFRTAYENQVHKTIYCPTQLQQHTRASVRAWHGLQRAVCGGSLNRWQDLLLELQRCARAATLIQTRQRRWCVCSTSKAIVRASTGKGCNGWRAKKSTCTTSTTHIGSGAVSYAQHIFWETLLAIH